MSDKRMVAVSSAAVVVSLILSACGQPQVVEKEVVKEVVKEVKVEVTKEVVKEVVKEVEKVVVATAEPAPEAEKAKALRVNIAVYPDVIDPQKSSYVNEIAHLKLIYEGLTKLNEKLETIPGAAEKWDYNDEQTEVTFTLRKDLKYSDGSPLNAKRFEFAIIRNINPETAGGYGSITNEILGAPEWQSTFAEAKEDATKADAVAAAEKTVRESVQALDASGAPCKDYAQADCLTLRIKMSRPAPYFHTVLGIWVGYPSKEENIIEGGENWWNSSKYHTGNGPYILKSLEPFVKAVFVPNPNYRGSAPKVNVEYSYISDSNVAFQAYKNDEFDVVGLAAEDYPVVMNDEALKKQAMIYAGSCTIVMQFRNFVAPFTDAKVRQAFTVAIDRERWVKDVLSGLGAPTLTWIPPGFPGYQEGETRGAYDPEKALALIAESSYGSIDKLPPIVLTFADTPRSRTHHEWLAARFQEVFEGLQIELKPVEPTAYIAAQKDKNSDLQMFLGGWCADYPDPQNWLSVYWKSTSTFADLIGYANPEFDKLIDQADVEGDPVKRAELYRQAQDMLVEDNPVAFFWNSVNAYMVKPWVKGYKTTPQDAWPGDIDPSSIDIDVSMMP